MLLHAHSRLARVAATALALAAVAASSLAAQRRQGPGQPVGPADPRNAQTEKPPLHAKHWLAITGKPLSATAGAMMYQKGGNAVDAAAAIQPAARTTARTVTER